MTTRRRRVFTPSGQGSAFNVAGQSLKRIGASAPSVPSSALGAVFEIKRRYTLCTYLAMAITRKQLGITTNLTTFGQVLSLHAISKTPIDELFADSGTIHPPISSPTN